MAILISTSKFLFMFLVLSIAALPSTFASEWIVAGDTSCWAVGVDVQGWLTSIGTVRVGDTFDFFFENPQTVAIVDEAGYTNCDASGAQMNNIESGFLSYDFSNSGVVSFISAEPEGCAAGLKMQVHVE